MSSTFRFSRTIDILPDKWRGIISKISPIIKNAIPDRSAFVKIDVKTTYDGQPTGKVLIMATKEEVIDPVIVQIRFWEQYYVRKSERELAEQLRLSSNPTDPSKDKPTDEPKDELKSEPKDELKSEPKDELKSEPKDELKSEPKDDTHKISTGTPVPTPYGGAGTPVPTSSGSTGTTIKKIVTETKADTSTDWRKSTTKISKTRKPTPSLSPLEILIKNVEGVMNKLTPATFEPNYEHLKSLIITSKEHLIKVIQVIFNNAIVDKNVSVYMQLILQMIEEHALFKTNFTDETEKEDNFIIFITFLKLINQEFKSFHIENFLLPFYDKEKQLMKELKDLRETGSTDTSSLEILIDRNYEDLKKIKNKMLGNISLLGYFYLNNLIDVSIIQKCLKTLYDNIHLHYNLDALLALLLLIYDKLKEDELEMFIDPSNKDKIILSKIMIKIESIQNDLSFPGKLRTDCVSFLEFINEKKMSETHHMASPSDLKSELIAHSTTPKPSSPDVITSCDSPAYDNEAFKRSSPKTRKHNDKTDTEEHSETKYISRFDGDLIGDFKYKKNIFIGKPDKDMFKRLNNRLFNPWKLKLIQNYTNLRIESISKLSHNIIISSINEDTLISNFHIIKEWVDYILDFQKNEQNDHLEIKKWGFSPLYIPFPKSDFETSIFFDTFNKLRADNLSSLFGRLILIDLVEHDDFYEYIVWSQNSTFSKFAKNIIINAYQRFINRKEDTFITSELMDPSVSISIEDIMESEPKFILDLIKFTFN